MNSKIFESLTVYISFRGPKFIAQELGSHRTVAGAARCNPQVVGSSPIQGGLEEKKHPQGCFKVAGLRFRSPRNIVEGGLSRALRCTPLGRGLRPLKNGGLRRINSAWETEDLQVTPHRNRRGTV
jgi:hypothetical protein